MLIYLLIDLPFPIITILAPNVEGWGFETKSKTEKLAPVASLVSIHHLRPRTGLIGPVSV